MHVHEGWVLRSGGGAWHEVEIGDGRRLRVRFVVPGERVRVTERAHDPGHADLEAILEPSPQRREPACALFGRCGGCQQLHVAPELQLSLRCERIEEAIRGAGLELPREGLRALPAPSGLGYRCRARFQAGPGPDGGLRLGFHEVAGRDVVDAAACPLLSPELQGAWQRLRAALVEEAPAGLTGLELTLLPASEGALVLLNPRDRAPEPWPALGERLLLRGVAVGVAVRAPARAKVPASANSPARAEVPAALGLRSALGRTPAGRPVAAALGGFVQANLAGADLLCDELLRLAGPLDGAEVLELHAGAGLLSRALAEGGAVVDGVEADSAPVAAASRLPPSGRGRFAVREGRALQALREARGIDLLVTDPPRSGLGELTAELVERGPPRIVGAWCSVAALRRDLGALSSAYVLEAVSAIDLFPQTPHVETLVLLRRRTGLRCDQPKDGGSDQVAPKTNSD